MKVDYQRRFRIKLFAPLLTSFEQFAMQLATYLGSNSNNTIRQFKDSSSTTVLFVEHIENRTVLTMQFDERWRQAPLNSSLGIESVIDYEQYLQSTTTILTSATILPSLSSSSVTTTTILDQSSTTIQSAMNRSNSSSNVTIITIIVVAVVIVIGVAILLYLLVCRNRGIETFIFRITFFLINSHRNEEGC
jgi:hypothetical protein